MGKVTLSIAGRMHDIHCRDDEEEHLRRLGAMLDRHGETALRASGGGSAERTLLFVALILADEMAERERAPGAPVDTAQMERIADRLERLADTLEQPVANP